MKLNIASSISVWIKDFSSAPISPLPELIGEGQCMFQADNKFKIGKLLV